MIRERPEITDLYEAAKQLIAEDHLTSAHLSCARGKKPHIRRDYFGGHYDVWFAADVYPIAANVFRELQERRFLDGTPRWGYTDMTRLELTYAGKEWYYDELRRRKAAAEGEQIVDQTPHTD